MATPQQPDRTAILAAVAKALESVDDKLGPIFDQLAKPTRFGRVNRALIAVVGLLVVAVIVLGYIAIHNAATVSAVHQSNIASCQYNNTRLANQAKALNRVLEAAQAPASAPKQAQAASAAFEAKAHAAVALGWKPRDCVAAYSLNK